MSTHGKPPRKPRTPSHAVPPREADERPATAEDRPTGLPGPQIEPPSTPVSNGRDELGRFGKANAYGKGHAGHKRMAELRGAVLAAATPEILSALTKKLAVLALEGDVAAARLLMEYSCGKSIQPVEVSGPDGSPLERSAGLSAALGAALGPFSEEIRFAVLGVIKRAVDAARVE